MEIVGKFRGLDQDKEFNILISASLQKIEMINHYLLPNFHRFL